MSTSGLARGLVWVVVMSMLMMAAACGDDVEESQEAENGAADTDGEGGGGDVDGDGGEGDEDADGEVVVRDYQGAIGPEGREVTGMFPSEYDVEGDHPLLFLLHGIGSNASQTIAFFGVSLIARQEGWVVLVPEGTVDSEGRKFWNATSRCCDFDGSGVDDLGYLEGLIDEAVEKYAVDEEQVYVMGLSNGGFMAHRMACDLSEKVRGIVSFNGGTTMRPEECAPEAPVHVFHVHSTNDGVVPYGASMLSPGAQAAVERWVEWNGCDGEATSRPDFDLTGEVDGEETAIEVWDQCEAGGSVEFWTIQGGSHVPLPMVGYAEAIMNSLEALR